MSYAYVGCRTTRERNARGKGLKVYEISEATGEWKEIQCLETLPNPSYQAMDLEEKYLYSVHGDNTQVSSYKIEADGTLSALNTIEIGGKNPVFITPDRTKPVHGSGSSAGRRCLCHPPQCGRKSGRDCPHCAHGREERRRYLLLHTSVFGIRRKNTFLLYARRDCRATARSSYSISIRWTAA